MVNHQMRSLPCELQGDRASHAAGGAGDAADSVPQIYVHTHTPPCCMTCHAISSPKPQVFISTTCQPSGSRIVTPSSAQYGLRGGTTRQPMTLSRATA